MMMMAGRRLHGLAAVALLGTLACNRPSPETAPPSNGTSDELSLLMLAEARAWQRRADLQLADGDVVGAIASVQEVMAIRFPAASQEAEEVRLDACARLARLYQSSGGEAGEERALSTLDDCRKSATRDSFLRAQIESVAADVYEARAHRLTDVELQKSARRQALQCLEKAIEITKRLQRALLGLSGSAR